MPQPKSSQSRKVSNPRLERILKCAEDLRDDAKTNAKHIIYQSFGSDKNKTRRNDEACDRGTSSGPARYCSAHLRPIYGAEIIGDNNKTEWCVEGRHKKKCCQQSNVCRLCHIDSNNNGYIKLPMINIAEAITNELRCNPDSTDRERYNRTLQSFLTSHVICDYPSKNKDNTILRIKVNDQIWLEYFIKLAPFSSILKTSTPSGYKYKDRISIGRRIKIQNNVNRDLIFCIEKDASYNDPDKESQRPVVNCVGFWNLLEKAKQGDIRNIIQLNEEQGIHVSFGFMMKNHNNVNKIEVELECTRHRLGLNKTPITLWTWPNSDDGNSMSSNDGTEQKSNSGSPTISTQSVRSARYRSISPVNSLNVYPNTPSTIPSAIPSTIPSTIPRNVTPTTLSPLPPLPPPYGMSNNTQYQPQTGYGRSNSNRNNGYQQSVSTQSDCMSYNNNVYDYDDNSNTATFEPRYYGGFHAANYVDNRYDPYRRAPTPQRGTIQTQRPTANSNYNAGYVSQQQPQSQQTQQIQQNNNNNQDTFSVFPPNIDVSNNDNLLNEFPINNHQTMIPSFGIDTTLDDQYYFENQQFNNQPLDNQSLLNFNTFPSL